MRPALQRLLKCPYALCLLRNAIRSNVFSVCRHTSHRTVHEQWGERANSDRYTENRDAEPGKYRQKTQEENNDVRDTDLRGWSVNAEESKGSRDPKALITVPIEPQGFSIRSYNAEDAILIAANGKAIEAQERACSEEQRPLRQIQLAGKEGLLRRREWQRHLSTVEQYKYESDLDAPQTHGPRLINKSSNADDWLLWLELIRFRRRHIGIHGTQAIYKEIIRRDMQLPAKGSVGKELWDLILQAGHQDPKFLEELIAYASKQKQFTGSASPRVYKSIIAHALKTESNSALRWHTMLKDDFAPSIDDYKKLFGLSVTWNCVAGLRPVYEDFPLPGMYATIMPELCRLQMYDEAAKWHHLMCENQDVPSEFNDLRPLLAYLAQAGDHRQVEQVINSLNEAIGSSAIIDVAARYVRENGTISREIMNQKLGEVHGVAPKQLSDSFCARLFATKLFAVKTIISGLQMMAVESIGPMSLREIASRDGCYPEVFLNHLGHLKDAGVLPDNSIFSVLVQNLARTGNHRLLQSLVECDIHPDTFEDLDLQEKLLAGYYEADDQLAVERTLAILTTRCSSQKERAKWWWNLVFRSHVTLRRLDAVRSIMGTMQKAGIAISARSSRHLRVCWLSKRQVARRAERTQELSIIIRATQNTMRSGGFVPIISWREIMRRLGMAGRLVEVQNLALWLVNYYSGPAGQQSLPTRMLLHNKAKQDGMEVDKLSTNRNPQKYLRILFTTAAQHAIVAWGFQQEVKVPPKSHYAIERLPLKSMEFPPSRPLWTWGLVLLRKLQERGVPIQQDTISRICKHRLNALFGHGCSNRAINRRAKWINETYPRATRQSTMEFYVREMENIWGQDLFRHQLQWEREFGHRRKKLSRYWVEKVKDGRWPSVDTK